LVLRFNFCGAGIKGWGGFFWVLGGGGGEGKGGGRDLIVSIMGTMTWGLLQVDYH